jgi:transketolase
VCDVLAEECPVIVRKIGVNDEFGRSGPAIELLERYGLCCDNIVKNVKEIVKK